ncbi:NB-ARC domain-containing protein [Nonomuraea sp. NPDC050404]|uniref:ATP-binding protein n=1 Tax=Nonomuraea sp. NPDC050404 TaxID=3155783 RepID=UPI00340E04C0
MSNKNFRRCGNLQSESSTFVGRARLLATLEKRLHDSRLVTVTGVGGVGKSRTVLRLAHMVRAQYPDGVWCVDVARLKDASAVEQAIAAALGLTDGSSRAESPSLREWVGERHLLLVLDTCEHLVRGCAQLVHELLKAAPKIKVLVTSRQPLHLPYERVVPVPPLEVPGRHPVFANESVQLFAAKAEDSATGFVLDEGNLGAVAELCRRLDGIPLAIELAAARLRGSSVEQLLADRRSLLTGADRAELPRHQTLRAAIAWSHELCEPAERLLWARLSVFARDFELDAVSCVCADERLPAESIPELLSALVDKSILIFRNDRAGGRYRLLDSLAEYGGECLDELRQSDELRRRHLEYYLSLARRSEDAWSGPRQIYWFVRMRQEHGNVRAAIEYALGSAGKEVLALRLLSSLWFMWVCCGFARDGQQYIEQALAANPELSEERCNALWVLSYVYSAQGNSEGAQSMAETCKAEAGEIGDARAATLAVKMLGTAALLRGDLREALELLRTAVAFTPDLSELNPGLAPAIVEQALVLTAQGDPAEAEAVLRDCLRTCEERGELWVSSHAYWALAGSALATSRVDEALMNVRASLRIKQRFHDTLGTLLALETAARIFLALGQPPLAARLLGALEENWRTNGPPQMGAPWMTGEHEACRQECRRQLGDPLYEATFEEGRSLGLDEASALALGEWDVPESTALEIRVTDGDDGAFAKVEDAVVQVAGAFGFEVPTAHRSPNQRYAMKFRAAATEGTVDEQLEEMDRALRDEAPRGGMAQSGAVEALITAMEGVDRAVVLVEQTLLVAVRGKIVRRRLPAAEQAYLDNHRYLFNDPDDLLHELDQLEADGKTDELRQTRPKHRETIVRELGEPAARALDDMAAALNYEISVSTPQWAKSGHTESRLLALVVTPPPNDDEPVCKVVAKVCPPGPASHEPARHHSALTESPENFCKNHLVGLKRYSPAIGGAGGYVLLQDVAGGSFTEMCQMAELESPREIISAFEAVFRGLICEWNGNRPKLHADIGSDNYLRSELREKFQERGKLRLWAQEKGLLRPDRRWIVFMGERTPQLLPNPLAMVSGDVVARHNVQHLRGLTHGDLHTGNILIPRTWKGELLPEHFRLVDLTTFDKSAPLTRDPAMLVLSIVARHIPQDPRAEEELFDQIVRGGENHDLFTPLMLLARDVGGELITHGFRDDWRNQMLLSLQAAALLHCTFANLDRHARWWFFRLAARCGAEYLRSTDSWQSPNEQPGLLRLEDMGDFHMPPRS